MQNRASPGITNSRIRFAFQECTLGFILVAGSEMGICFIALGDDQEQLLQELQNRFPRTPLINSDSECQQWAVKVVDFVETPALGLDLPLDIRGTRFQRQVWQALQKIPVGETVSYKEIAQQIGAPKATRAVAGACAANPLALVIPCHRVVRSDGGLSGYYWGIERKAELLRRETKA